MATVLTIAVLSLMIWLYLLSFRGQFWRVKPVLFDRGQFPLPPRTAALPSVAIIIPARNEAAILPESFPPLLQQDYAGDYRIYLVDDQSADHTGEIAQELASDCPVPVTVIESQPLPAGWTGKLWALHQGIAAATEEDAPDYLLLTDADIGHHPASLTRLINKAVAEQRDLVSLMVKLRCTSGWEKLLIPAFVFFFAQLYPFTWVNQPDKATAAAAGGCSLVRRSALEEIGGIAALKDALIDDCTLAYKIKHRDAKGNDRFHNIWLGVTQEIHSLRPYENLDSIWQMVARTAYTQLNYSPLLLVGTLIGMCLVYLAAPIGIVLGVVLHQPIIFGVALSTYALMSISYIPINQFYKTAWFYPLCLPFIGLLYSLMTVDSARQHWQGKGGNWKGRTYEAQMGGDASG
ncbi:glycosyltransferase [filamentous cyanobacterium LEGE 11480]|uniref:Glycosyltransferase n=2 Tax=Romeriopsis TaxID=2992131 RepID=A0A928VKG6_9CYAN|nr:glycosyltransferase [Romeriopsis navalis LEGE 11480]